MHMNIHVYDLLFISVIVLSPRLYCIRRPSWAVVGRGCERDALLRSTHCSGQHYMWQSFTFAYMTGVTIYIYIYVSNGI